MLKKLIKHIEYHYIIRHNVFMEASIYMKAKEVLELLQISRPALTKYVK